MAGNDQRPPHFMVIENLPMLFDSEVRRNNYVQSLLLVRNLGLQTGSVARYSSIS